MANAASMDLNLLVVLHHVLETGSATAAAKRLHVTQSAVSNALARLRHLLGDPLVVRHASGLAPTPRAAALRPELEAMMRGAQAVLEGPATFDPATTTREFTLACNDYYGVVILPRVVVVLRERAPHATLRLFTLEQLSTSGGLARDIDVHVGMPPRVPAGCLSTPLFADRFVCLTRRGARAVRRPMTLDDYLGAAHVRVAVLDIPHDPIDTALAARGLRRNVVLTVPHFSVVPLVVEQTGCVATLSGSLAEVYAGLLSLDRRAPPVDLAEKRVQMLWHERSDADEGSRFFRSIVTEATRSRGTRRADRPRLRR